MRRFGWLPTEIPATSAPNPARASPFRLCQSALVYSIVEVVTGGLVEFAHRKLEKLRTFRVGWPMAGLHALSILHKQFPNTLATKPPKRVLVRLVNHGAVRAGPFCDQKRHDDVRVFGHASSVSIHVEGGLDVVAELGSVVHETLAPCVRPGFDVQHKVLNGEVHACFASNPGLKIYPVEVAFSGSNVN